MKHLSPKSRKKHLPNGNIIFMRAVLAFFIIMCVILLVLLTGPRVLSVDKAVYMLGAVFSSQGATSAQSEKILIERTHIDVGVSDNVRLELKSVSDYISSNSLKNGSPTILIYHTHTLEAYTPTSKYPYTERGGSWRTDDNTRNIVTVGEALALELRSRGFNVLHDTTNHEPPKLSTSYSRSEETMKKYKEEYPSLIMFIDVHRDASGAETTDDYCIIDEKETARVMFVVGTGEGATGTGFAEMPDFESNYALARALTEHLSTINSKLVRDIRVKTGRYNQHISNQSLLIEVGHNRNTLEQALAAVVHVADAIDSVCGD